MVRLSLTLIFREAVICFLGRFILISEPKLSLSLATDFPRLVLRTSGLILALISLTAYDLSVGLPDLLDLKTSMNEFLSDLFIYSFNFNVVSYCKN